jgi:hypothetical protein
MTYSHYDHNTGHVALPQLSDDAAVQIHDFIYFCLDLFEARYGDQIHRYYQDRSRDGLWEQDPLDGGDLPF